LKADVFLQFRVRPQIGPVLHGFRADLAACLRNFGLRQLDGALDQTLGQSFRCAFAAMFPAPCCFSNPHKAARKLGGRGFRHYRAARPSVSPQLTLDQPVVLLDQPGERPAVISGQRTVTLEIVYKRLRVAGTSQGPSFEHQPIETGHPTLPLLPPAFLDSSVIKINGLATGRAVHAAPAWSRCSATTLSVPPLTSPETCALQRS